MVYIILVEYIRCANSAPIVLNPQHYHHNAAILVCLPRIVAI